MGDSTGVGSVAWVQLLVNTVAPSWPTHTVKYRDWNTSSYNSPTTIQTGSGARTIDFYNASVASTNTYHPLDQYFDTRVASLQPHLVIVNHGHNEGTSSTNRDVVAASMINLCESITARCPTADLIIVGQNPETNNSNQP